MNKARLQKDKKHNDSCLGIINEAKRVRWCYYLMSRPDEFWIALFDELEL